MVEPLSNEDQLRDAILKYFNENSRFVFLDNYAVFDFLHSQNYQHIKLLLYGWAYFNGLKDIELRLFHSVHDSEFRKVEIVFGCDEDFVMMKALYG